MKRNFFKINCELHFILKKINLFIKPKKTIFTLCKTIKMKKFLFLLFIIYTNANAQNNVDYQINFETNSFIISNENEIVLKAELQKIATQIIDKKKLEIIGYTDTDGDLTSNIVLSRKRANEVANYFVQNGIPKNKIIIKGENYKTPIADNETEVGKSKNRRVTIKIIVSSNDDLSIYKFREKERIYSFNANKEYIFKYKSGTIITIPENTFVDKNGKNIDGNITLKYSEYRNKLDFVLSGIPMNIDTNDKREYFNSAGMFKIEAFKNGEEIFIKPDKSILSDFRLTKALPNLNLYGLDTIKNKWIELSNISDANGKRNFGRGECGYFESEDDTIKCNKNLCESLKYIHVVGLKYLSSEIPLSNLANPTNPINYENIQKTIQSNIEKIISNENRIKSILKKISTNKISYQLKKTKNNDTDVTFEIIELNDGQVVNKEFEKGKWSCNSSSIISSVFTKNWRTCLIENSKNDKYTISLSDSINKISISEVYLESKRRVRKRKRAAFKSELLTAMNQNSFELKKNDSLGINLKNGIRDFSRNNKNLKSYTQGTNDEKLNQTKKDSIDCFINYSGAIMTQQEKSMSKTELLTFFDENSKLMLERYTNMVNRDDYKQCIEQQIAFEKQLKEQAARDAKIESINDKTISLLQQFNITSLGIFNVDKIYLLQNQVELLASYELRNGEKINPEFIYLLDEKVNGILRFDNYRTDINPSRFPFNPESKNTLLIFDENGESYLFPYKDFQKLDFKDSSKIQKLVISKINSKKELEKEFL